MKFHVQHKRGALLAATALVALMVASPAMADTTKQPSASNPWRPGDVTLSAVRFQDQYNGGHVGMNGEFLLYQSCSNTSGSQDGYGTTCSGGGPANAVITSLGALSGGGTSVGQANFVSAAFQNPCAVIGSQGWTDPKTGVVKSYMYVMDAPSLSSSGNLTLHVIDVTQAGYFNTSASVLNYFGAPSAYASPNQPIATTAIDAYSVALQNITTSDSATLSCHMAASGNLLYVGTNASGLYIVDTSGLQPTTANNSMPLAFNSGLGINAPTSSQLTITKSTASTGLGVVSLSADDSGYVVSIEKNGGGGFVSTMYNPSGTLLVSNQGYAVPSTYSRGENLDPLAKSNGIFLGQTHTNGILSNM